MKTRRAKRHNSTHYRLTVYFAGLLSLTVLLLSILIIGVTINQLFDATKEQTELLTETLTKADTQTQADWLAFLETYTSGESSPYYVRVVLTEGELIYSQQARQLFADFGQFKQLFFLKDILWTADWLPYYYTTTVKDGAQIAILVAMEDKQELILSIMTITGGVTVLLLLVGALLVYRFAKNFSRPLQQMNQEISSLDFAAPAAQLTVPETPQEVQQVARSFNQLLHKQQAVLKREQQFVADASHELRTPLAAIRGHLNLIKRRGPEHPEVIFKSLAYMDSESQRMVALVEQLLVLGRSKNEGQLIDFAVVLRAVLTDMALLIPQELVTEIGENHLVLGSEEHFRQIIRNLLENAAKYTPTEGQIKVCLRRESQDLVFEVADTGIGIMDADKPQIFERFYRVDQSRSSQISGSGIGLAIVKELVTFYGGKVEVQDNQPRGSRFIVKLPLPK